ncbi:hypothetical protein [Halostella salina]|uniref:hypothetical protein n=1 Tax=Halostella salina TaxID=1547897 RepID=UPI0013CEAA65|nr:hypothetical protein [Halostella salina]
MALAGTEEVTFKGHTGKTTITCKIDTQAQRTTIDHKIAARVGPGPVTTSVIVNGEDRRPVAKVWVEFKDFEEIVEVSLSDRKQKTTNALIGQDILDEFTVDLSS